MTTPDPDLPPCPGRHNEPFTGAPTWCPSCSARIRSALCALVPLYAELWEVQPLGSRAARASEVQHKKPDGAASPSPAADQADEILRTLCAWEDALRSQLGRPAAGLDTQHWADGAVVRMATSYLDSHHTAALSAPFAVDYGREILRLHGTTLRMLKADAGTVRMQAPCPDCDQLALIREDGSDYVTCCVCGWYTTRDRYELYGKTLTP